MADQEVATVNVVASVVDFESSRAVIAELVFELAQRLQVASHDVKEAAGVPRTPICTETFLDWARQLEDVWDFELSAGIHRDHMVQKFG
jgi:hypothetical protein